MPVLRATECLTILFRFLQSLNLERTFQYLVYLVGRMECHGWIISPRIPDTKELSGKSPPGSDTGSDVLPNMIKIFRSAEGEAVASIDEVSCRKV
jgi:hypothetical protein